MHESKVRKKTTTYIIMQELLGRKCVCEDVFSSSVGNGHLNNDHTCSIADQLIDLKNCHTGCFTHEVTHVWTLV